ncbi:hypothetical protein ACJJTC_000100 [Scirpophaga incertulas]
MALCKNKIVIISALLLLSTSYVQSTENDDADDGISIETEEENEYQSPAVSDPARVYLAEHFDDVAAFKKKWVKSEAKKQGVDENIAKYDGKWEIQAPSKKLLKGDSGLVLTTEAKHAAISALLDTPFEFTDKPLIVQYEVTMQEGQNCGGAYIKLLSRGINKKADLKNFHDQTPYTIMFGPDKCGNDNKLHFIFRHKNPKNGTIEEKHSKKPSQRLEDIYKDKAPHLYTLIVRPDNTFSILVDNAEVNSGSLLEDFTPPVNPPAEIDDPTDKKPDDWDEREKVDPNATKPEDWDEDAPEQIVDVNAVKPDGWMDDEPEMIPDPDAVKPEDWDEDMDGEWEPPLIDNPACGSVGCGPWKPPMLPNPAYKGIWRAPLVANPNYRGKWTPRRIPNPHYFRDDQPFRMTPIHAVGFELWSMSPMLLFDNLLVTDDETVAELWAKQTFSVKLAKISKYSDSVVDRYLKMAEENPMLYYFYAITVLVVGAGIIYVCCGHKLFGSDDDKKKSEAVTEDDPHSEGEGAVEGAADGEGEADGESGGEGEGEGGDEGGDEGGAVGGDEGGAEGGGAAPRATKAGLEHARGPLVPASGAGRGRRRSKKKEAPQGVSGTEWPCERDRRTYTNVQVVPELVR